MFLKSLLKRYRQQVVFQLLFVKPEVKVHVLCLKTN